MQHHYPLTENQRDPAEARRQRDEDHKDTPLPGSAASWEDHRVGSGEAASDAPLGTMTKLVIIEGIMGSGKSSMSRSIAHQLVRNGLPSQHYPETWTRSNPTDFSREFMAKLPIRSEVWRTLTADELQRRSEEKWRDFVAAAQRDPSINVLDGQLFSGDHTVLMLMDEPVSRLSERLNQVIHMSVPLQPTLIYLYQEDIDRALEVNIGNRGLRWLESQEWKLASPLGRRLGLAGAEGLMALYRHYRLVTDRLATSLSIPTLMLETSSRDWRHLERQIAEFLGVEARYSWGFRLSQWLRAKHDDILSHR